MKKIFLSLLFIFIFLFAFSFKNQGQNDSLKTKKRLSLNIYYSPFYSFKKAGSSNTELYFGGNALEGGRSLEYNSKDETGRIGHEVGVFSKIWLGGKFFSYIGLSYSQLKFVTKKNTVIYITDFFTMQPLILRDTSTSLTITRKYNYFSLPIHLSYTIGHKNKMAYNIKLGGSYDLLWNYKIIQKSEFEKELNYKYKFYAVKKYPISYISLLIGLEMQCYLRKNICVGIEPYLKSFLFNNYHRNTGNEYVGYDNQIIFFNSGIKCFLTL